MGEKIKHYFYIYSLVVLFILITGYLAIEGYSYYSTSIDQRFFHPEHQLLKPSGYMGHGLGIAGSLMMLLGVSTYMLRKRVQRFSRFGILKYWLEFHIFLCSLGPMLILFHTSFKFGGLVAVSFWSMVAVVLSGIVGRYIYIQIPRTIEGRELNLSEINQTKDYLQQKLVTSSGMNEKTLEEILQAIKMRPDRSGGNMLKRTIDKFKFELEIKRKVKQILSQHQVTGKNYHEIVGLVSEEIKLNRKIDRLISMQNFFKYWHIAHLPFALLMLIIMLIHVGVAMAFGAHWIF